MTAATGKRLAHALVWGCLVFSAYVNASERIFKEGVHYQRVNTEQRPRVPSGKEVIEFLWYGCGTCYAVQSAVKQWLKNKPSVVNYRRLPAVTKPEMAYYARAFFTMKQLKAQDKAHIPFFTAVHVHQRPLDNPAELERFFVEQGVDAQRFRTVFNSGFIATQVRKSRRLGKKFGIAGVPTFVVNGRYRTDPTMVSSPQELFQVIDFLLTK